jgi:hypothetical protein
MPVEFVEEGPVGKQDEKYFFCHLLQKLSILRAVENVIPAINVWSCLAFGWRAAIISWLKPPIEFRQKAGYIKSVTLHEIRAEQPSRGRATEILRTFITPDIPRPRRSSKIFADDPIYEEFCEKVQSGPTLKRSSIVLETFVEVVIGLPR